MLEVHKNASFLLSMEAKTHLVIAVANITEPVASIVLTHRSYQGTRDLVQFIIRVLLLKADL